VLISASNHLFLSSAAGILEDLDRFTDALLTSALEGNPVDEEDEEEQQTIEEDEMKQQFSHLVKDIVERGEPDERFMRAAFVHFVTNFAEIKASCEEIQVDYKDLVSSRITLKDIVATISPSWSKFILYDKEASLSSLDKLCSKIKRFLLAKRMLKSRLTCLIFTGLSIGSQTFLIMYILKNWISFIPRLFKAISKSRVFPSFKIVRSWFLGGIIMLFRIYQSLQFFSISPLARTFERSFVFVFRILLRVFTRIVLSITSLFWMFFFSNYLGVRAFLHQAAGILSSFQEYIYFSNTMQILERLRSHISIWSSSMNLFRKISPKRNLKNTQKDVLSLLETRDFSDLLLRLSLKSRDAEYHEDFMLHRCILSCRSIFWKEILEIAGSIKLSEDKLSDSFLLSIHKVSESEIILKISINHIQAKKLWNSLKSQFCAYLEYVYSGRFKPECFESRVFQSLFSHFCKGDHEITRFLEDLERNRFIQFADFYDVETLSRKLDEKFAKDLLSLANNPLFFDVILRICDSNGTVIHWIKAHRCILSARNDFFSLLLKARGFLENHEHCVDLPLSSLSKNDSSSKELYILFFKQMYSGSHIYLNSNLFDFNNLESFLEISTLYSNPDLKQILRYFLSLAIHSNAADPNGSLSLHNDIKLIQDRYFP
jgi:hypothetical protein